ncbi:hypothetical protein [Paraburkholderia graminis]|uniref:hypothetical protein n=1 Tax=Paraburkholderia graminis TaxID=60548 RepID=UPI00389AC5FD
MASAAAIMHADTAQDAINVLLETHAKRSTRRDPATREANGQRAANSGKCGERETGREPWRLNKKEIGNVIGNVREGQRNMPEILSPPRG